MMNAANTAVHTHTDDRDDVTTGRTWTLRSRRRHYFDSSVPLGGWDSYQLDLVAGDLDGVSLRAVSDGVEVDNASNDDATCLWMPGLGEICPYGVIDVDVAGAVESSANVATIVSIRGADGDRIDVVQRHNGDAIDGVHVEIVRGGTVVMSRDLPVPEDLRAGVLRVRLNGRCLSVHVPSSAGVVDGEVGIDPAAPEAPGRDYCGSLDIGDVFDLRDNALRARFRLYGGVRIPSGGRAVVRSVRQYLTCGTGQADPRVLQTVDGDPIVDHGRIWLSMTTRGYMRVEDSCQGVYELDLRTFRLRLVSILAFRPSPDDPIGGRNLSGTDRQWHAADLLYDHDRDRWLFAVTSHGDDHGLWQGTLPYDPRDGGFLVARASRMHYRSVGNEEDPHIVRDRRTGTWLMTYVRRNLELDKYETFLARADAWDGTYVDIAGPADAQTGPLLQTVDGRRYVFAGLGDSGRFVALDPDDGLRRLGFLHLDQNPDGRSVWPLVVPLPESAAASGLPGSSDSAEPSDASGSSDPSWNTDGTRCLLITFNRDPKLGQTPTGKYSYGDVLIYDSVGRHASR
ncbi:hypothetical protein JS532_00435 [Bifidobacterium callimiconis]|uniref:hypothetical protein n=1 Tax=Bifidobacterium callimiconis TaxID=2306973 RepID=UPI001BDC3C37|nr:hypothetical protein [Bifidobacterium callimiconis]MBT1176039.1 hypothetical protein [Bifidobacterium callimiconis]